MFFFLPHPPYSPAFAPSDDFYLVRTLQKFFRWLKLSIQNYLEVSAELKTLN